MIYFRIFLSVKIYLNVVFFDNLLIFDVQNIDLEINKPKIKRCVKKDENSLI